MQLEEQERRVTALRLADLEHRSSKSRPLPAFRPKTTAARGRSPIPLSAIDTSLGQGGLGGGGGGDSVHSGSTGGMTQAKARRRPSRKSMDAYSTTSLSALSPAHNKILQAQLAAVAQHESNNAYSTQNHVALNRSSTQSSGNYSQDDFAYTDGLIRNESPIIGRDETPYVEVEATLPEMDFDRPKTVHSNVRPPSREKEGSSGIPGGGSGVMLPAIVMDGYNL